MVLLVVIINYMYNNVKVSRREQLDNYSVNIQVCFMINHTDYLQVTFLIFQTSYAERCKFFIAHSSLL